MNFNKQLNKAVNASEIWSTKDAEGNCTNAELKKVNCDEEKFVVCAMSGMLF